MLVEINAFFYQNGPDRACLLEWTTGMDIYVRHWVLFILFLKKGWPRICTDSDYFENCVV